MNHTVNASNTFFATHQGHLSVQLVFKLRQDASH